MKNCKYFILLTVISVLFVTCNSESKLYGVWEGIGNNPFTGISFDNDNTGTLLYANGNDVDFTYAGGDGMLAINTSGRNKSSVTVEYNIIIF